MHQIRFPLGRSPTPRYGSLQRPQTHSWGKGGGREVRVREEGKGKGGEGQEGRGRGGEGEVDSDAQLEVNRATDWLRPALTA